MKKAVDFVRAENLINAGDSVCVALSGGPDSMALLHWLLSLQEVWSLKLSAVHIHHGLRKASDDEEVFVRDWCRDHQVPLSTVRADLSRPSYKGMSTEEAARSARYEVFEGVAAREGCLIALAHHMDDQAETVLLNLLRGSGPQGMRGMLPKRDFYIRPLLDTGREEIMAYCQAEGLPYVTDETNTANDYTRNYLRNEIIPRLKEEVQPRLVQRIYDTSRIMRAEEAWLDSLAQRAFEELAETGNNDTVMDRSTFSGYPAALQRRLVRKAVSEAKGNLRNLTFDHVHQAMKMIAEGETGKVMDLPGGIRLRLDYGKALIESPSGSEGSKGPEENIDLACLQEGQWLELGDVRLRRFRPDKPMDYPKNVCTKWFDCDKIGTGLTLRTRAPGDWLSIGSQGHKKKLKDIFIDRKISRQIRDRIPVLAKGSEVIWAIGCRASDNYMIDATTQQVLEVSYSKEEAI